MGRIIIDPQAALFNNTERQVPTSYGRSTLADINAGLDVAQMAGEIAGPIVVGLGNMGVEDKVKQAQAGLLDLQRNAAKGRSAAARQMMADTQPRNAPAVRRDMEEALPLSVVGEQTPAEMPTEMPSMMRGMMQPGYKNPYGMRLNTPEASARARAADLMLGPGAIGKLGNTGDLNAFDAPDVEELDWSHQAPVDRRSVMPKSRYQPQDLLRGMPAFMDRIAPQEEQIPPGIFGPPQQFPQPGTPEFRQLLEAQQPTAETMSAGGGPGGMEILRRVASGLGFGGVPTAKAAGGRVARRGPAQPSLQQRATTAQQGVGEQFAMEEQKAREALAPAMRETQQAVQTSEEMQQEALRRMQESQPDAAELALQARLQAAQNRPQMQVEDYDYSIPQLEALIIQAKQSGDPEAVQRVAQAINASSLRGARAQSVFADMLGGAHLGRERKRLLANLTGVAQQPESAADIASGLSKATYQRIMGERMQQKPLEFVERAGMNQAKAQTTASKAFGKAPEQAANVVNRTAAARKAAAEAEVLVPKTSAQMARDYASAANARANARQTNMLAPFRRDLLIKKINEQPREAKGLAFTFNGLAGSDQDKRFFAQVYREAEGYAKEIAKLSGATTLPPDYKGMSSEDRAKAKARYAQANSSAIAKAGELAAMFQIKRDQLGDAAVGGKKYVDFLGLSKEQAQKIMEYSDTPEFQAAWNRTMQGAGAAQTTPPATPPTEAGGPGMFGGR